MIRLNGIQWFASRTVASSELVVNDGIMYVDTTNEYRKSMPLQDALILAGRSRMRPILMTTLTTVFSMIPMDHTGRRLRRRFGRHRVNRQKA